MRLAINEIMKAKQLKIDNNTGPYKELNKCKLVKNDRNWWETADQLAFYKRGWGTETRDYCVSSSRFLAGGRGSKGMTERRGGGNDTQ